VEDLGLGGISLIGVVRSVSAVEDDQTVLGRRDMPRLPGRFGRRYREFLLAISSSVRALEYRPRIRSVYPGGSDISSFAANGALSV
jgi:hypothetical protein